ncbi:hypothetical protein [Vallitalea guaymasensis]|uniref:hypothetical protein n=1 Tax=Vallitalea guaymasensis TaxID=1185412 RepID=UPI000DE5236D|nr:hypothetical protein [Vallitalea guaymasensis]
MKKIIVVLALILLVLLFRLFKDDIMAFNQQTEKQDYIDAPDRVVLRSIPSDVWYQTVYLIADQLTWMDYKNFTVQVGDMGNDVYNFPDWYHGKYDPALYREDINNDTLEDIIIVLNNDLAGIGKPNRDIHILNQIHDPYRRYEEAPVEPIESTINSNVKIDKHDNIVTILIDKKKYYINISKYNYGNPRDPYINIESIEYAIKNGKLFGTIDVSVVRDESYFEGIIGHLNIEYFWDGEMYKPKSIVFQEESTNSMN